LLEKEIKVAVRRLTCFECSILIILSVNVHFLSMKWSLLVISKYFSVIFECPLSLYRFTFAYRFSFMSLSGIAFQISACSEIYFVS